MAEFAYNNANNANLDYIPFELNYSYHLWISYKYNVNPYSKFKLADKLLVELRKLIIVYRENLYYA